MHSRKDINSFCAYDLIPITPVRHGTGGKRARYDASERLESRRLIPGIDPPIPLLPALLPAWNATLSTAFRAFESQIHHIFWSIRVYSGLRKVKQARELSGSSQHFTKTSKDSASSKTLANIFVSSQKAEIHLLKAWLERRSSLRLASESSSMATVSCSSLFSTTPELF